VGVQVSALHWREDIVLAVMNALQEHFRNQPGYPCWSIPKEWGGDDNSTTSERRTEM